MKKLLAPILAALAFAACVVNTPKPSPTVQHVQLVLSEPIAGCTFHLTSATPAVPYAADLAPAGTAAADFAAVPWLVQQVNATASCAGFTVTAVSNFGTRGDGKTVVTLTATPIVVAAPLPPAPTRDQIATAQNWSMQGETWNDATCTNGQTIPMWDPIITPMSADCRLKAYARKKAYGDRKVVIPIVWSYQEPGLAIPNGQGTDWTADMPTLRARVLEAVQAGLYVDLNYGGDGESILATDGSCAWIYNGDPSQGKSYGVTCATELIGPVDKALRGDGSSTSAGNLLPFVVKTIGWDGTFYGQDPVETQHWSDVARASDSAGVLSMEFNVGHLPFGEGGADWQPSGKLWNFDIVKAEFEPASQGYHDDATWQISDRLLCGAWSRPAEMPARDDPTPPCLPKINNPRGQWYVVDYENDTYCWVRLSCSIGDVVQHALYMRALGWSAPMIDSPLSIPSVSGGYAYGSVGSSSVGTRDPRAPERGVRLHRGRLVQEPGQVVGRLP